MTSPESVSDDFAAAQVFDLETQVSIPFVRLEQCVVSVRAKELQMWQTEDLSY